MRTLSAKGAILTALLVLAAAVAGGAQAAVAGDHEPPGCNGTIHLSASATEQQGTEPKYTKGATVYAHGSGFDASESFSGWDVVDVNDGGETVASGGPFSATADGSFDGTAVSVSTAGANFDDAHEYKLTVYWTETLPNGDTKVCQKSKNFFLVGTREEEEDEEEEEEEENDGGGDTGGGGGDTGGGGGGQTGGGGDTGGSNESTGGGTETSGGTETTAGGSTQEVAAGSESNTTAGSTGVVGGVAGVATTKPGRGPLGQVAGAQATLPFTGFPAWAIALIGGSLLLTGFGLRRAAETQ